MAWTNGLAVTLNLAQNYQKDSKVNGEKILLNTCTFVTRHEINKKNCSNRVSFEESAGTVKFISLDDSNSADHNWSLF